MNLLKHVGAFQIKLEFESVGFCGEGKTGVPREKPLGAWERTNNKLNSIWRRRQDSNPGQIDERRVLSALPHPCSPKVPKSIMWYYKPEIRVVIIWLFLHQFRRHIKWSSLQEIKASTI